MVVQQTRKVGWGFWLRWVLINAAGWALTLAVIIGLPATMVASHILSSLVSQAAGEMVGSVVFYGLIGSLAGSLIGAMQAYGLRKFIPRIGLWILASLLGCAVSLNLWMFSSLVGVRIPDVAMPVYAAIIGAFIGFSLGVAQLFVLRQYVHQSVWWVFANTVGLSAGAAVAFAANNFFHIPIWYLENGVMGAMGGAVAGALTGLALMWLLNHPKQSIPTAPVTQVN